MTGRTVARVLLAGGMLAAMVTASCGVRPSGVITGRPAVDGPTEGIRLYLVWHGDVTPVLRPTDGTPRPADTLALLAAGPDKRERDQGFTSEVPTGLVPASAVTREPGVIGFVVAMSGPVTTLSATAVDQIACTVGAATAAGHQGEGFAPITIIGVDGSWPLHVCPLT